MSRTGSIYYPVNSRYRHSIVWLRRDLRLRDNTALREALEASDYISLVFIFDSGILKSLPAEDRRLSFIWESIQDIDSRLHAKSLPPVNCFHGNPADIFPILFHHNSVDALFYNHDYEPLAVSRDSSIQKLCKSSGVYCHTFKDQVIFEKNEVLKEDATPYKVFTAYKNRWLVNLSDNAIMIHDTMPRLVGRIKPLNAPLKFVRNLKDIGFVQQRNIFQGGESEAAKRWHQFKRLRLDDYQDTRDMPSEDATSHLSTYLRFGNLSIRSLVSTSLGLSGSGPKTFLSELIWREFFMMILWHFPYTVTSCFNPVYNSIPWINNRSWFRAWCDGKTGIPLVDAGMRELNATGYMHNRVRMITASFLVKHLHVDWRWGEKYFADKLLDYELSSNNGNWQWAAGTGVDAAPYFRIFNPVTQGKKFDPEAKYIKRWIHELAQVNAKDIHKRSVDGDLISGYPEPLIDLDHERKVCLNLYQAAKRLD